MDLGLTGRAYLATGASRGIGAAIASALLDEGASVLLTGRDGDRLTQAAASLGAGRAERVAAAAADNADPATAEQLVAAVTQRFGRVDGAVISVGGPAPGSSLAVIDSEWQHAVDTVLMGTIRLCRAVAEAVSADGALLLILSSSVKQPLPGLAISNALRPGLAMFAKGLADELGPRGIRVNSLLPGRIDTDRIRELDGRAADPVQHRHAAEAAIPLRRYGEPAEVGRVGAFLLSPAASYLTGAAIPVDGGLLRSL
jgi:3-oxoacyl-[acyl-carrier protein] reductase